MFWIHGDSRLSRVLWSEVEGHLSSQMAPVLTAHTRRSIQAWAPTGRVPVLPQMMLLLLSLLEK